ncbi:sterol desaturase family protein [Bacillus sp. RAR_GA_16]|uniref:sterol desaturase family protein n=1 Tax=Bacillus sp. RAR_GA_16 TaxID=2876774 RepID=UPI001CCB63F1|nr:sterol desaturase family protein [Bacillus sp. RAR_GA_16]MCA0174035.1 sterol desaturase family protein [Bacillus sp. RAR_GA_16]
MKRVKVSKFVFYPDIMIMSIFLLSALVYLTIEGLKVDDLLFVFLGLLIFTISEYSTHRFFFHKKAPKNKFFLKVLKRLHYDHHHYPDQLNLLFMPLWYSTPQFVLITYVVFLISHSLTSAISVAVGLMMMLLIYEWKHFKAHQPGNAKTKFGRWLKKTHLLHHYKNENYWFGVTNPFVDMLFGTLKDEKEVSKSLTVRKLDTEKVTFKK